MNRVFLLLLAASLVSSYLQTSIYIVTEQLSMGVSIDSQYYYFHVKDKGLKEDLFLGFGEELCNDTEYLKVSQMDGSESTPLTGTFRCNGDSMQEEARNKWEFFEYREGVFIFRGKVENLQESKLLENIEDFTRLVYKYKVNGEVVEGTFEVPYPRLESVKKVLNQEPFLSLEILEVGREFYLIVESDFKGFTWIGIGNSMEGADIAFIGEDPSKKKSKVFVFFNFRANLTKWVILH